MNILSKLKETAFSVLPVMLIVSILGGIVTPIGGVSVVKFLCGGCFLILGLTVFLLGVDLGIQPMGERCGAALTQKRSLPLLLSSAFIIGVIVTAAEPDIQVFSDQVRSIFPAVNKTTIVFAIAGGVGVFMTAGLAKTVLSLSIKWILFISYTVLFLITLFAPQAFVGIAFDSGGATTGPMTVPFIMALGLGVSSVRRDNDGSFGLTGIASVGPVMAVLIYSLFVNTASSPATAIHSAAHTLSASEIAAEVFKESLSSILPLFGLFMVFQLALLKMTPRQFTRLTIGFIYALIGLTIFLFGVNFGFMQAGKALGEALGVNAVNHGGVWYAVLIGTGLAFGAIIVCAEPAVWVLSEQVEQVSGGTIKRKVLLIFLATGTAIAIGLAMLRAVMGFNLAYLLIPGYIIAMVLMYFTPSLFAGIAFDSGGVASGPLTSTFILSFTLGAANGSKGNDSFGVIALVAMMPLIAIQLMGIIYERQRKRSSSTRSDALGDGK